MKALARYQVILLGEQRQYKRYCALRGMAR